MAETIHQRIKRLLDERGLKQNEAAKRLGVKPQAVQGWTKKNVPKNKNLIGLARLLDVTVEEILGTSSASGGSIKHSIIRIDTYSVKPLPLRVLGELSVSNMLNSAANAVPGKEIQVPSPTAPGSVAFSMEDQSMEPEIRVGDIVVISPGKSLEPGKFIAAHIRSMGANVFRKFVFDGPDHCSLVPLSQGHRTYKFTLAQWADDVEVLGTYAGHYHPAE